MDGLDSEALDRLAADPTRGPIVMLNLLKFEPDGGRERYFGEYASAALPMVEKIGARLIFAGECSELLIGHEDWDMVLTVEYPTAGVFVEHLRSERYQAIAPIREKSLTRSVLYETLPASLG